MPLARLQRSVLVLLPLCAVLVGCISREDPSGAETAEQATTSRVAPPAVAEIAVAAAPRAADGIAATRIVSIVPSATELLGALGAGDALVGRSLHCDAPPWVLGLPSVGSGLAVDPEVLLTLRPDLVVGSEIQRDLPLTALLRDHGIPLLLLPDARLEDLFTAVEALGEQLALQDAAHTISEQLRAGLGVASVGRPASPVRTLLIVGEDPLFAVGRETFLHDVLDLVGGENVITGSGWIALDREAILGLAPDVVVVATAAGASPERWRFLTAPFPRTGLCDVPPEPTGRLGPRIVDTATALRGCLERARAIPPPE